MNTVEIIAQKTLTLTEHAQSEVLDFVNFLSQREAAHREGSEWASASASQLAAQYADADAIYDQA